MHKSKFTYGEIINALRRVEAGLSVVQLCQELGVSRTAFYRWRQQFGFLVKQMSKLEAENARLRKMYVEGKLKGEIIAESFAKKKLDAILPTQDGVGVF